MPLSLSKLLSTHAVAELVQVDPSSVVKWINDGILPSYRTPGGHRRIRLSELLAFAREQGMYIPAELVGSQRVVLVSSDTAYLTAMSRSFRDHPDVELTTRSDVVGALVRLGERPPAALLVDVDVAEMDPFKVAGALSRVPATKDVRVILVAKTKSAALERRALELGAIALLGRDAGPDEVLKVLSDRKK